MIFYEGITKRGFDSIISKSLKDFSRKPKTKSAYLKTRSLNKFIFSQFWIMRKLGIIKTWN